MTTARGRITRELRARLVQARHAGRGQMRRNLALGLTPRDLLAAFRDTAEVLSVNPRMVLKKEVQLAGELGRIARGRSHIKPPPHDTRFRNDAWETSGYYRRVLQAYLVWRKTLFDILASSHADERSKARARFLLMQLTEAAAPTNNPLGNPGFVDRVRSTRGRCVLQGARNFWHDLRHNHQMPSQVDRHAFRVGRDLARSPGAVVYRSEVCEIIQYAPTTATVHARPVVLVPPQINRFYIVDLKPDKSFVRYALDSGLQMFAISWRNPDARHRRWNLDTYAEAVLQAIEVARDITGSDDVDLLSACAGGMTSLSALAYLHATGAGDRVHSQTLLVTAFDAAQPMPLTLFATPATLRLSRRYVQRQGVIDGAAMARIFSWLKPTEMVWLFFVNNYLMGKQPPSFDVLYWNADSTRLPAGFHADAIRMYRYNSLIDPAGFEVLGRRVSVPAIDTPCFIVAGHKDHLVPWRASYAGTQTLAGETRFVLTDAGHVQTLVTPPRRRSARFYVNEDYVADPDEWLNNAGMRQGSWWPYWLEWKLAGVEPETPAPAVLGSARHPAGDPAPGRYVFT